MTKEQKQIAMKEIVMLNKKDVMELTGWCSNVVDKTFCYDKDFPRYQEAVRHFKSNYMH